MPIDVSGDERIEVLGESFYRPALNRLTDAGRRHVATLAPNPANAHDRNASKWS